MRSRRRRNPISNIGEIELVSIVGGIGERRALNLLDSVGGFQGLLNAGIGEIASIVGESAAVRITSAMELGRRILSTKRSEATFPDAKAVVAWSMARLAPLDYEELWLLALDGRSRLKSSRLIATSGALSGISGLVPRDILRLALREGASAFLITHNHPSGDPSPSREDEAFTEKLQQAAKSVGIPFVDHVIVTASGRYSSFMEMGLL